MSDNLTKFRVPIRACLFAMDKALMDESYRLPKEVEELVFTCPVSSYLYAKKVLKSRIPEEHENVFKKGICFKQNYRTYDTKKMTSTKEVDMANFSFFHKDISGYYVDNYGNMRYTTDFSSDNFYIHNEYISLAFLYAKHVIKDRLPNHIEQVAFLNHPVSCLFYCMDVVKQKSPDYLEEIISKNSFALLNYAIKVIKSKLPQNLEKKLNPQDAIQYAAKIGVFSDDVENEIFINDLSIASDYAINIKKSKFSDLLHNNMILGSMQENANVKIKNYILMCGQLDTARKAWELLCIELKNFCKVLDNVFQNRFNFDFKIIYDKIILNDTIEIKQKNICVFQVSTENSKQVEPYLFKVTDDYENEVYDIISYCSYLVLKKRIKEIDQTITKEWVLKNA